VGPARSRNDEEAAQSPRGQGGAGGADRDGGATGGAGARAGGEAAHGEFESECPGYCGAQDTFYAGTLKGVGRIYQQTFIDTYSKVGFAKLYTERTPITAADLVNDRVLPFFEQHDIPLNRILTDRGTEYPGPSAIRTNCTWGATMPVTVESATLRDAGIVEVVIHNRASQSVAAWTIRTETIRGLGGTEVTLHSQDFLREQALVESGLVAASGVPGRLLLAGSRTTHEMRVPPEATACPPRSLASLSVMGVCLESRRLRIRSLPAEPQLRPPLSRWIAAIHHSEAETPSTGARIRLRSSLQNASKDLAATAEARDLGALIGRMDNGAVDEVKAAASIQAFVAYPASWLENSIESGRRHG
jgi:hypothetical protein